MRLYIQNRFVSESFAFENVCVMSHHGLKAMLQSPFGHLPLWRLLGLLEVRLQLEGSWPFFFFFFFFFRQDRGLDPSGSGQLSIKESDRDQYAPMCAELNYFLFEICFGKCLSQTTALTGQGKPILLRSPFSDMCPNVSQNVCLALRL